MWVCRIRLADVENRRNIFWVSWGGADRVLMRHSGGAEAGAVKKELGRREEERREGRGERGRVEELCGWAESEGDVVERSQERGRRAKEVEKESYSSIRERSVCDIYFNLYIFASL